ncbi:hypothetical protein SNE40_001902 [Patella caerulea]|uniref:CARD domain-containing protein n=1 Tax=Patella caerulea TaxID=87958 RepID=A0AAN8K650_PATCE
MESTSYQKKYPVNNLDILRRNHSYLVRELTPSILMVNMSELILNKTEKDEIDNLEGRREKMEKMMEIIYSKNEDDVYINFVECLKKSKYDNVVSKLQSTNISSPCRGHRDIEMLKADVKTLQHDVVKLQQQQQQQQRQQQQKQLKLQQMESKLSKRGSI